MVAPYIADPSGERFRLQIANPNSSPRLSCVLDRASRMVDHARIRKDGDRLYAYDSISSAYARIVPQLLKNQGSRRRPGLCWILPVHRGRCWLSGNLGVLRLSRVDVLFPSFISVSTQSSYSGS